MSQLNDDHEDEMDRRAHQEWVANGGWLGEIQDAIDRDNIKEARAEQRGENPDNHR